MRRDPKHLRRAAALVEADLQRTLGSDWSCSIGDDYVLTVTGVGSRESSLLHSLVEDEAWYLPTGQTPEQQRAALEVDAEEAVACEVVEVMRVLGQAWPRCTEHGDSLTNCEGEWLCNGPPSHGIALVGALPGLAPR
jgi:hypothetical protein